MHVAGRVMRKHEFSAKLLFFTLHADGGKLQVMADIRYDHSIPLIIRCVCVADCSLGACMRNSNAKDEAQFAMFNDVVRRGDIIGVTGFPGKSKTGMLSRIV